MTNSTKYELYVDFGESTFLRRYFFDVDNKLKWILNNLIESETKLYFTDVDGDIVGINVEKIRFFHVRKTKDQDD